jgi:DNA-directed RNA polymerase subunit N (RpoN/RPB10)
MMETKVKYYLYEQRTRAIRNADTYMASIGGSKHYCARRIKVSETSYMGVGLYEGLVDGMMVTDHDGNDIAFYGWLFTYGR